MPGRRTGTLCNALRFRYREKKFYLIHRIGRTTSGCILIGKNRHIAALLSASDWPCRTKKTYPALVHGIMFPSGTFDAPIGRDPDSFRRMAVTGIDSKHAVTHYKCLQTFRDASEVRYLIDTVRTHILLLPATPYSGILCMESHAAFWKNRLRCCMPDPSRSSIPEKKKRSPSRHLCRTIISISFKH
ncbi:MAG: pseudouridine synthase [Bulleidia sp.]